MSAGIIPQNCPFKWWERLWLQNVYRGDSIAKKFNEPPDGRTRNVQGKARAMSAQDLLQEISDYCRQTGLAESTFGRRAVNDGKLTSRLRNGGRSSTTTPARIRSFMAGNNGKQIARPTVIARDARATTAAKPQPLLASVRKDDPQRNFRF